MKKLLIIAALAVQVLLLITLSNSFAKKGVKWSNVNETGKLQAVDTSIGAETAQIINTTLNNFFMSTGNAYKNAQFTIKEIANTSEICIMEISVVNDIDTLPQKQVYELWAVLNKAEPSVFIQQSSDIQGFDYLMQ